VLYRYEAHHRDLPKLFGRITKGTIQKWIDKDTKQGWSVVTMKNIEHQHALAGSGQTGILARHPNIIGEIKIQLWALRTLGLAVSVLIARSIMLAIIKGQQPELLMEFKCSEVSYAEIIYFLSSDANLVLVVCPFFF
jgi:hypothetical protein